MLKSIPLSIRLWQIPNLTLLPDNKTFQQIVTGRGDKTRRKTKTKAISEMAEHKINLKSGLLTQSKPKLFKGKYTPGTKRVVKNVLKSVVESNDNKIRLESKNGGKVDKIVVGDNVKNSHSEVDGELTELPDLRMFTYRGKYDKKIGGSLRDVPSCDLCLYIPHNHELGTACNAIVECLSLPSEQVEGIYENYLDKHGVHFLTWGEFATCFCITLHRYVLRSGVIVFDKAFGFGRSVVSYLVNGISDELITVLGVVRYMPENLKDTIAQKKDTIPEPSATSVDLPIESSTVLTVSLKAKAPVVSRLVKKAVCALQAPQMVQQKPTRLSWVGSVFDLGMARIFNEGQRALINNSFNHSRDYLLYAVKYLMTTPRIRLAVSQDNIHLIQIFAKVPGFERFYKQNGLCAANAIVTKRNPVTKAVITYVPVNLEFPVKFQTYVSSSYEFRRVASPSHCGRTVYFTEREADVRNGCLNYGRSIIRQTIKHKLPFYSFELSCVSMKEVEETRYVVREKFWPGPEIKLLYGQDIMKYPYVIGEIKRIIKEPEIVIGTDSSFVDKILKKLSSPVFFGPEDNPHRYMNIDIKDTTSFNLYLNRYSNVGVLANQSSGAFDCSLELSDMRLATIIDHAPSNVIMSRMRELFQKDVESYDEAMLISVYTSAVSKLSQPVRMTRFISKFCGLFVQKNTLVSHDQLLNCAIRIFLNLHERITFAKNRVKIAIDCTLAFFAPTFVRDPTLALHLRACLEQIEVRAPTNF